MAYIDTMTGLGNRTAFLEENKSNAIFPGMISYIMMDANNLKTINDTLGHNKSDELIITIAKCKLGHISGSNYHSVRLICDIHQNLGSFTCL